ncbi:hypothetical protein Sjap_004759 [Stephania japonica]|uniref:Uncharacterized protein n=1 Tax=Stephania japonica TaxID=461633 RepID=A0AAP0K2S4_9MAGN
MLAFESKQNCHRTLKLNVVEKLVLQATMAEQNKLQELMLGLAAKVFRFMTPQESSHVFKRTGVEEIDWEMKLVEIVQLNLYPSVKAPRIRRFTIELVIWLMRSEQSHIYVFRELGMEQELENVMETSSELESFNTFTGSIGLNRYAKTMQSLIYDALKLLSNG